MPLYLCKSGKAKALANQYRENYTRLRSELFEAIKPLGATGARICEYDMKIIEAQFPGDLHPEGWVRPKKCKGWRPPRGDAMLQHFTAPGPRTLKAHPELTAFDTWVGCPRGYNYTKGPGCSGWQGIGSNAALFSPTWPMQWFSLTGPICVELPDVAAAKARAADQHEIVTDNVLDWVPKPGLELITEARWAFLEAKYNLEQEQHESLKQQP
jgi:hypothetical protein